MNSQTESQREREEEREEERARRTEIKHKDERVIKSADVSLSSTVRRLQPVNMSS